jgi:hypothetical protein
MTAPTLASPVPRDGEQARRRIAEVDDRVHA